MGGEDLDLPAKIRKIRKEDHLSQEQFASKLGVTRQAVSKWELGAVFLILTIS